MTALATVLSVIAGVLFGIALGMAYAMLTLKAAIDRADICNDDKRMIRDVLGIPQNGERQ